MGEIHDLVERFGRSKARELIHDRRQRRLIDIASEVLQDENQAIGITYSGFCLTSLPHRRLPDEQPWRRMSQRLTLMVEPGRLPDDERLYGVPYGSRARLILLYLQTQALQNRSPEVELGRSMRDWMGRMGVTLGGQSYRDVREQANRISACRLTFSWQEGATVGFVRDNVVAGGISLHELHEDDRQGRLWIDTVRLSDNFYQALCRHPVPIWEPALRHIANRSMAIDLYIWLSYRLHSLRKATPIGWSALHAQFGASYKHLFQFRPRFAESLAMALAVYPEARVETTVDGLLLQPSRPPVPERRLA
ncbi:MAG: replication protein RepA [Geminicoccaceae bacterium]|nr:replication protein RepA [Geminicoccaceae bacterium]